ncbi:hypothetical protein BD777DRAFT_137100 [Yarrowia lipolytica]|uniref:Uncharacterized protein n=1 Tax=Yarrowia lipolytica TaxID=4952 RepID=A0A371C110_YARLL|nr:hypothetical protein BKA90DRAFT_127378 [Yarrowia lipolytica]RDW23782.1 hypothetical protein B0I71DRAFT_142616 [Yarrowia lipolytica]RMI95942.1 hypothetical protein BD777DRAFT_137100 [Yarrowia lipolytica]
MVLFTEDNASPQMITNTPPTKQDPFLALKEACEDNPRLRPVSAVICDAAEDLAFRAGVITLFNELKMREQEVEELTNELQRMQKLNSELHNMNEQLQRAKTLISASLKRHIANQRAANESRLEPLQDLFDYAAGDSAEIDFDVE